MEVVLEPRFALRTRQVFVLMCVRQSKVVERLEEDALDWVVGHNIGVQSLMRF